MSANTYKRLNVSDTFVVPYTANKSWDIESASFADNKIVVNIGVNYSGSFFDPNSDYFTNNQYDRLVYDTINMIYYPSFLNRYIDTSSKASTRYNDGTLSTSSYYRGHVELGNIDTVKQFPTGSNASIYVINVPRNLTSEKILPTTFELYFDNFKVYDDGNYNLLYSGSNVSASNGTILSQSAHMGNVFYEQNVAIITALPNDLRDTAWRGANPYCVTSSGLNTGYKGYNDLEQYYTDSGATEGTIKANDVSDPDYIAPALDLSYCPLPSASPSVTPSVTKTPSVTPTVTPSITVSPTIPTTLSVTPTNTATPSTSVGFTPSVTPTATATPSVTPSTVNYTYYTADRYECLPSPSGFICNYVETICIANTSDGLTTGRFYLDPITGYIFNIGLYTTPAACLITGMSGAGDKNCDLLCSIV